MTLLRFATGLKAQQRDAALLSSRQNKQPHLGISTGSGYVVISRESAHILVDSRYYVQRQAAKRTISPGFCLTQRTRLPLSSIK
ncbi:aminopeptidase P family N-terminal domain-containing protein [Escherichia coli]